MQNAIQKLRSIIGENPFNNTFYIEPNDAGKTIMVRFNKGCYCELPTDIDGYQILSN